MTREYKPWEGSCNVPFIPEQCKASVYHEIPAGFHQCLRKPWKDGWCKQHHPESVAKRELQSERRWQRRRDQSPSGRLVKARQEIARLRARIAELEGENASPEV